MFDTTIAAVATPPGRGGVGIIRISGTMALPIAARLCAKTNIAPREIHYARFIDPESKEVIDQGLVLYFKAPHSFTGEDVVELHSHGSPVVLDRLLTLITKEGAQIARPGEFSERAFLNQKIDLTQAEAIADLIDASSQTAARMAMRSLAGEFSRLIQELNKKIIHLRMYVEAAIDFPDEEIDFLHDGKVAAMLAEIIVELEGIQKQAHQGAMIKEGLTLVIAGRPNAGKSTLINQLAQREIAIVTHVAGTTRDVIREHILLDDIPLYVIDTAGLRQTEDLVEQEGIKRAKAEIAKADCLLLLHDLTAKANDSDLFDEIQSIIRTGTPVISVMNKMDQNADKHKSKEEIYISAKTGEGIEKLKQEIKKRVGYQPAEGLFIARRRHLQALMLAQQSLAHGQIQLISHHAGELLAEDLRQAHRHLGEITGEFCADDLLGAIFSSFCIGK